MKQLRYHLIKDAAIDLRFLLSRGYHRKGAVTFVGNHHQLTKDERNIIFRGVFTKETAATIRASMVKAKAIRGHMLLIDGYNVTITLENAIKGHILIKGNDGFIRDISGIFRGFRQTEVTEEAWGMILDFLKRYRPNYLKVLFDAPYSNSKRLAQDVQSWMDSKGIKGEALIQKKVDSSMIRSKKIKATSDSTILIRGGSFFDIAGHIACRRLKRKPLVVP